MKKRIRSLLFEAYRRNSMGDSWEMSKPIGERWLGLGTESAYRPALKAGIMAWHDGRIPPRRCMGWLVLTPKGIELLAELEIEFSAILDRINKETGYQGTFAAHYMLAGGITAN